jgi:dipeptidyl aminopeptidase/acylaminoacyl peptidase
MQGHFFQAGEEGRYPTVITIPGWPGRPEDVLGLGAALSQHGLNVLVLNPRGLHGSEGTMTFANALEDIAAVLAWVRTPSVAERFGIDTDRLVLGGHSFGGGMALAYAAKDSSVRRLLSVAGNDHGQFIRQYHADEEYAGRMDELVASTRAPDGPAQFDPEHLMRELHDNQSVYGLCENADNLAGRSILLIGGWDDVTVSVDRSLLPFYRALRMAGADDVTFLVYHDDHDFSGVRERLANDIREWIKR